MANQPIPTLESCDINTSPSISSDNYTSIEESLNLNAQEVQVFQEDKNSRKSVIPTIIVEESDISSQFQILEEGVEKLITADGCGSDSALVSKISLR
jgi:hypothetical protein